MADVPTAFVAPEGSYSFLEEHKPHLVTVSAMNAALYPTRISSITIRFQTKATSSVAPGLTALLGGVKDARAKEKEKEREREREKEAVGLVSNKDREREGRESISSSDNGLDEREPGDLTTLATSTQETAVNMSTVDSSVNVPGPPHFAPTTLFPPPLNSSRRRSQSSRKMQSIRTTSSSFVTRLQTMEGLSKVLGNQSGEATYLFYNASKSFIWTQIGQKGKEPLAKVTFSAFPACHDINKVTASADHLDVVIGFSTGDIIWFDPITSRYARINKQPTSSGTTSNVSHNACTSIRWVPSSVNLFVAGYADGTMVVFDRDREDGHFTPREPHGPEIVSPPLPSPGLSSKGATAAPSSGYQAATYSEWDPLSNLFVTPNPLGLGGNEKTLKNPVSHWKVSKKKILDFVFSPDVRYVAVVSEDGCLRVIDALHERLIDTYSSYFGTLTTVAWSPDGRFILTGGQDDLITIFSPSEQRVIARCQGHSSFVSNVVFDPLHCDGRTYRFGSVGEDNRLLLWDFSSGALHRPKLNSAFQNRASISSTISLGLRRRNEPSTLNLPMDGVPNMVYHPAPSRNDVSVLQPIQATSLDGDLLTRIEFTSTAVLASTRAGLLRVWSRPSAVRQAHGRDVTITS
ncbi:hypothetical protein FRC14_002062 [Serendipita sp. 396]|nr:hypothetical protein FRC14_002062 [Serendipita sp. 396]KAG8788775.1 hypothetical protein FRC15_002158 [Serendipita sp. 397]KAG8803879.1 hypothetical protein FRC16_002374 [Serendipita sp. 398]KAG8827017.1 hypothetical protein FRC19_005985 [Serendipita sp. 401]KAG8855565.1 hypothetical protein FRB91_001986 [Serendipita sp. 411]KAG8876013.1 hypothetical protein FRC20_002577 [Serendipita sp. 405]